MKEYNSSNKNNRLNNYKCISFLWSYINNNNNSYYVSLNINSDELIILSIQNSVSYSWILWTLSEKDKQEITQ